MKLFAVAIVLALMAAVAPSWAGEATNQEYVRALNTMGGSGISWIDTLFRLCVVFLVDAAKILGISYEEINIWLFVVIHPLITLVLLFWVMHLRRKIKRLKQST
jgi:hypothetical protein